MKAKGNVFFKEKKFEEAITCYEQAIELCPEDHPEDMAMFNHNIAACYENMVRAHTGTHGSVGIFESTVS